MTSRYLTGATSPATVALGTPAINWANLRGAFMVNDTLYTGWSDGTLKSQSFDGNTFGPLTTLPLNGNQFASELTDDQRAHHEHVLRPPHGSALLHQGEHDVKGNGQSPTTTVV